MNELEQRGSGIVDVAAPERPERPGCAHRMHHFDEAVETRIINKGGVMDRCETRAMERAELRPGAEIG